MFNSVRASKLLYFRIVFIVYGLLQTTPTDDTPTDNNHYFDSLQTKSLKVVKVKSQTRNNSRLCHSRGSDQSMKKDDISFLITT